MANLRMTSSSVPRAKTVCMHSSQSLRVGSSHSQLMHSTIGASKFRGTQLVSLPSHRRCETRISATVEANLFNRMFRVIRSYANNLVSSAEDPEKLLDQTVIDMQNDLIKLRQAAGQVMASQKQLEKKYQGAQDNADQWYRRAELALQKGDDDLAKEALTRRKAFQDSANQLKLQLDLQIKATEQLIGNTRILEGKLNEARSKKDTLKARAKSAETSKQISEMMQGINTGSSALAAFDRMEEKVLALEAESEATLMLAPADQTLENKFAALEGGGVEDELANLKKNMFKSKPTLPEGRPIRDAIDWELEELRRKSRE